MKLKSIEQATKLNKELEDVQKAIKYLKNSDPKHFLHVSCAGHGFDAPRQNIIVYLPFDISLDILINNRLRLVKELEALGVEVDDA